MRDEASAALEGRTAETVGRLRRDLTLFEDKWRSHFTDLLVRLESTVRALEAKEDEVGSLRKILEALRGKLRPD